MDQHEMRGNNDGSVSRVSNCTENSPNISSSLEILFSFSGSMELEYHKTMIKLTTGSIPAVGSSRIIRAFCARREEPVEILRLCPPLRNEMVQDF